MTRKTFAYLGALIGLYIVVSHASGSGKLFTSGASGASQFVKTLQGR
jgi:hypothetical protein